MNLGASELLCNLLTSLVARLRALSAGLFAVVKGAEGSQHHESVVIPTADVVALLCWLVASLAVGVRPGAAMVVHAEPLLTKRVPVGGQMGPPV